MIPAYVLHLPGVSRAKVIAERAGLPSSVAGVLTKAAVIADGVRAGQTETLFAEDMALLAKAQAIMAGMASPDIGLPWFTPGLSDLMGGCPPGDIVVVGAQSGGGKSTFGRNIADYCAGLRIPTQYLPLEQDGSEFVRDWACMRQDLNVEDVCQGKWLDMDPTAHQRYNQEVVDLSMEFLRVREDRFLSAELIEDVRAEHRDDNWHPRLVVIDHLHRLSRTSNYFQDMENMARALKEWAVEDRLVVIVMAQCKRKQGDVWARLKAASCMSDLEGGGRIEQEASIVTILRRTPRADISKADIKSARDGQASPWTLLEPGVTRVDLVKHRRAGWRVGQDTRIVVQRSGRMLAEDDAPVDEFEERYGV